MPFREASCRIRIGITGHRALPAADLIRRRFRRFLETGIYDLLGARQRPANVPVSFCAVTALAEGADRLLAEEVLGQPSGSLEAVLPMPEHLYAADFKTASSRAEFNRLCRLSSSITVLNGSHSETEPNGLEAGGARSLTYEEAGRYIVDHCDLLVAVWDGGRSRGPGGTAEIVEYARERGRTLVIIPAMDPCCLSIENGGGMAEHLEELAMLNRTARQELQGEYLANVSRGLFAAPGADALPEPLPTVFHDGLLPFYVAASLLAKKNQKRRNFVGAFVPLLSVAAVACVALGILLRAISPLAFALELVLLLAILWLIKMSELQRNQQLWLEFRVLAERLRCAVFVVIAGLETEPRHDPSDWTAAAAHDICERVRREAPPAAFGPGIKDYLLNRWIIPQRRFHDSRAERMERRGKWMGRLSKAMFLAALAVSASHVLVFDVLGHIARWNRPPDSAWILLSFLAVVLPAAGAGLASMRSQKEYERQSGQSRAMERQLAELQRGVANADSREEFVKLVRQACRLCIQEARDWRGLMDFAVVEAL